MNRRQLMALALTPLPFAEAEPKIPDGVPFVYIRRDEKLHEMTLDKALVLMIEQRREEQRAKNG
jgi:hypothetical protein